MTRSYFELERLETFEERFDYLQIGGTVGHATFGYDRHVNQAFYASYEWKNVRTHVISRDNGCDLGIPGFEIHGELLVHHMEPVALDDILHGAEWIIDPEYLITTTKATHNAIHYGDRSLLRRPYIPRTRGDTNLWQPLRR